MSTTPTPTPGSETERLITRREAAETAERMRDINGRRTSSLRAVRGYEDLTGADLAGADMRGMKLVRVNLTGANLTGANLWDANLTNADFTDANLSGAFRRPGISRADMEGVKGLDTVTGLID